MAKEQLRTNLKNTTDLNWAQQKVYHSPFQAGDKRSLSAQKRDYLFSMKMAM